MTLEKFRARVVEAARACLASAKPDSVATACRAVQALVDRDPDRQAAQYRALRELVDGAAADDDRRRYTTLLAMHDALLRAGAFAASGNGPSAWLFDEQFYLEYHEDVAAAVRGNAFGDGFDHFVRFGAHEGRAAHPWRAMPGRASDPAARPVVAGKPVPASRILEQAGPDTLLGGVAARIAGAPPDPPRGLGVNLIGYHSANLGLGVSVRHYRRFLMESGLEVCPVEIPVPGGRSGHDTSYADQWSPLDVLAPHAVNLFLMNPKDIADHVGLRYPAIQTEGRINVALPFWELARLPRAWVPILARMDILLAASGFIEHALRMDVDGPCIRNLGHPIYVPDDVTVDRRRWGIPDGAVAFVSSFEMASDINRKNPFAAILAFEQAFGRAEGALLIVKVNNAKWDPGFAPQVARLREITERCPNVRVLDEALEYTDVLSLFASCDVLVSLHRAEGLGLALMEAMTLGKPVIATGWSGNMAFMSEQDSCLVGYSLVPVRNSTQQAYSASTIRDDACWADARIDEAAHWMRRLAAEPELRARIGRRAALAMTDYQRRLDAQELVATVHNLAARRGVTLA